ncbi:MAG: 3-oxoacyl-ACP reductase [Phycisphaerales bacterium]|nr:MAG: 3-oxoacyl-ACP reductase [Phycisphaerales bacterium]
MQIDLSGRTALVCGSSQGIGLASAVALAELGCRVTLFARDPQRLGEALAELPRVDGGEHDVAVADFTQPEMVLDEARGALERAGGVFDILVNNTGGPPGGPILQAESRAFLEGMTAHLVNNHNLAQLVIPGMAERGYGRIVNIISTSVRCPIPGLGVSNTVRAAVAAWAKTLAGEVAGQGITVNSVLPGFTDTARLASLFEARAKREGTDVQAVREQALASIPMGRLGTPEEVAAAVAFYCTPAAGYITGTVLAVDGGRTPCL